MVIVLLRILRIIRKNQQFPILIDPDTKYLIHQTNTIVLNKLFNRIIFPSTNNN